MLLGEILERKKNIEYKIVELEKYLKELQVNGNINPSEKGGLYTISINDLFELYSKLQSYTAIINNINNKNEIGINDKQIILADAIFILETLRCKLVVLDSLIGSDDFDIRNNTHLKEEREKIFEELIILNRTININNWNTNIE